MTSIDQAVSILQKLSAEKMEVALYFLELLALKEEMDATEEVRSDIELTEAIHRAKEARREGRPEEFMPWEVRRGV